MSNCVSHRAVTEDDFRLPEFRGQKPEDYEFDGTGELARKDRWETTVRRIVGMLEDASVADVKRRRFTLDAVLASVAELIEVGRAEPAMEHTDLARRILTWQGRTTSDSREPGADPHVDALAAALAQWTPPGERV